MKGKIAAISISTKRGIKKENVESALLIKGQGIKGDAHFGSGKRQLSLLALESIDKMKNPGINLKPGNFAENITTSKINLSRLSVGSRLKLGKESVIEITQKGKVCHNRCSIFYDAGECIMPKEGVFAEVIKGGFIKPGDVIEVKE